MPFLPLYDEATADFRDDVLKYRLKEWDDNGQAQLTRFLQSKGDPRDARQSAIELSNDAGRKYGGIKIGDKTVISKKWIDTIVGNISNAIAVGDKLMAAAPETVSAAWFVVKLGLGAIQADYALYSVFGGGLTVVTEVMILIPHYDEMFDRRDKAGYKIDSMTDELFKDIKKAYVAVLDFMFSVQRHIEASNIARVRHVFKNFIGGEANKFSGKQDAITAAKVKVLQSSDAAFKRNVFDNMEDIQARLKTNIDEINNNHKELLESLQDLKANLKQKSRWDYLKQDFATCVKTLDPYEGSSDLISVLRDKRARDTCTWVFDNRIYQDWFAQAQKPLLCLTGPEAVGKSVLAVAVRDHFAKTLSAEEYAICYFSCTAKDSSLADLGDKPVQKIQSTIMFYMYRILASDEMSSSPELLEEANKLFQPPSNKRSNDRRAAQVDPDEYIPPFIPTMERLAQISKRKLVLVLDGVDRLRSQDQTILHDELAVLISKIPCWVLAVCRDEQAFLHEASATCAVLEVDSDDNSDAVEVLDAVLVSLQALTPSEQTEAKQRVALKAGKSFAYITEIAIPFLKEPFQRPLSKRLDQLPEGVLDTYSQALQMMQPAYADLLQTALTWTLYARRPVKIQELMEAHSGIYLSEFDSTAEDIYNSWQPDNMDLLRKQLEEASGPFLRTWREDNGAWYCSPKDIIQVRQFCNPATDSEHEKHDKALCARCRNNVSTAAGISLPEGLVHLQLALVSLRHLNSPLYQRRFGLCFEPNALDSNEDSGPGTPAALPEDKPEHPDLAAEPDEAAETKADDIGAHGRISPQAAEGVDRQAPGEQDGSQPVDEVDRDDSQDSEDREGNMDRDDLRQDDFVNYARYEITEWPHHLREAEKLFSAAQRKSMPEWQEVFKLLDKLTLDSPDEFSNWVDSYDRVRDYEDRIGTEYPLGVAANLGLQCWAEHLIREKGFEPHSVPERDSPAILLIRPVAQTRGLLKFFLQQPGLDQDVLNGSDTWFEPVVHTWLEKDGSVETLQMLLEAGADLTRPAGGLNETGMHRLAMSIDDPKALDLALTSPGPPNINVATESFGETPLHILTRRSDLTVELLDAFLANGADVDKENAWSIRALHQACWAGRPDIVRRLLEHGVKDIDDPDDDGSAAIHAACSVNSLGCVKALIEHKANVNLESEYGRTPLHEAAWTSEPAIVQELINSGAGIGARDKHNRTPFWFACYAKDGFTKARILLDALKEAGIPIQDINVPSRRKRTPLRFAATHGYHEIVQELIDMTKAAGLDVAEMLNMKDELPDRGHTALHRAVLRGQVECVKALLGGGADACITNGVGRTPMQLAQEQWSTLGTTAFEQIVLLLAPRDLERIKTDYDLPALAATNNSVKVLEKLASLGINLNNADTFGWTPLLLAQRLNMTKVEKFLRSHAAWKAHLPSKWVAHNNVATGFKINDDGTSFSYTGDERFCITTDRPLPGNLDRYYFEVTLSQSERFDIHNYPSFGIGFSNLGGIAYDFPGWEAKKGVRNGKSWGYHGDDGWCPSSVERSTAFGEAYGPGCIVGAGVDLLTQTIWFTRNGDKVDFEHQNVSGRVFPMLGLMDDVQIQTNFGDRDFRWEKWNEETGRVKMKWNEVAGCVKMSEGIDQITQGVSEVSLGAQEEA